jgi:hypothetical protein
MSFIEVFKTNVQTTATALHITAALNHLFPNYQINFDLEDEENILRIDGFNKEVDVRGVIRMLHENGWQCSLLL